MPTYLDRDISGDDTDVFPGNQVLYAAIRLSTLGGDVRDGDVHSGQILRAGWLTFGDRLNVIDSTDYDYWRAPVYLNFPETLWTPEPTGDGSNDFRLLATRVKWHLSFGTFGHIYVFGL